jgi:hypothetical protein
MAQGNTFSMCRGIGGAPPVLRRSSPPQGGPHGGGYGMLKARGVVYPGGCSVVLFGGAAVRSLRLGAGRLTPLLAVVWRLI